MSASVTPLAFQPPEVPEDKAREGYYALLGRLFYAGPDAALLAAIGCADEIADEGEQSALGDAWNRLAQAARAMEPEAAQLEYDELFVGTGKAEVTPYATHYLAETGREKILVRLKDELAALGLSRAERAHEPEDHMAALFEVMRHLISMGSAHAALQKQQGFFERYLARSVTGFCGAISASPNANFYRHVARFAEAFFSVESEALKVF
jgi:TorA maturation chaperone TorD